MSEQSPRVRFAPSLGFLFPAFAVLVITWLGALYSIDTAKQAFLICIALLLMLAGVARGAAAFYFSAIGYRDAFISILSRGEIRVLLSILPYATICVLRPQPATQILYLGLILLSISFGKSVEISENFAQVFAGLLAFAVTLHLLVYFGQGMPDFFQSFFPQKNSFALNMLSIFLSSMFILSISNDRSVRMTSFFTMGVCVVLIFLSRSRGTLLDLALFVAFRWSWSLIAGSRFRYWFVFIAILGSGLILVPAYVLLSFTAFGQNLNNLALQYTGIGLFSGRNLIWPAYIFLVIQRPFLGYGFGDALGSFLGGLGLPPNLLGLSAHNLYLMVATQTGVMGVISLLLFLGAIWWCIYRNRYTPIGAVVGSAYLTILFNEMFEVSLTQNNLYVILLVWFLIGLGMQTIEAASTKSEEKTAP